jgi:hypothetical protein
MPLIIPPGYAQAIIPLAHSSSPRKATVTFGVKAQTGGALNPAAADRLTTIWDNRIGTGLATEVTIGPTELIVGQDGGVNLVVVGTTTQTGASASDKAPSNCALLMQKRTARGGRRGRGRCYIPWYVSDNDVVETGAITAASIATANQAFFNLLADIEADASFESMVVLHSSGASATGDPDVVTSLLADPTIATQRRRLGR